MVLINLQWVWIRTDWNVLSKKDNNFSGGLLQMTSPRIKQNTFISPALCSDSQQMRHLFARHQHLRGGGRKKKGKYFAFDFFEFCSAVRRRSQNRGRRRAEDGASEGSGSSQSQLGKTGGSSERACVRGRPGAMLFVQRERDAVSAAHLISCKTLC